MMNSSHRSRARRGAKIGGSEGKVALASKTPVDAAGTDDAVHLLAKLAIKRKHPWHELEAQTVVNHREAAGG